MSRRITVVTSGHLSTCPRMLKAADALHEADYAVRVISVRHTAWAAGADARLHEGRAWRWEVIDTTRGSAPGHWLVNGARYRAARALAGRLGSRRPYAVTVRAFSRTHDALVGAILRDPGDFLYGGTTGALAAVAAAARRGGIPYGVDFEDFHCGTGDASVEGRLENTLAAAVMADVARDAVFLTAGSAAIVEACRARFGVEPLAVNNVFPLPDRPPSTAETSARPRLYWFSQTIGPGRGLEHLVRATGLLRRPCELHLRGVPAPGFAERLRELAGAAAPLLSIHVHTPTDPAVMVDACRSNTVGLALEPGHTQNSDLSLSNKALTYPLAGLPVLLTATSGQRALAADLGEGACAVAPGDVAAMAEGLGRWFDNPGALQRAREASWDAARRRWHWEHETERGTFLHAIGRAVA